MYSTPSSQTSTRVKFLRPVSIPVTTAVVPEAYTCTVKNIIPTQKLSKTINDVFEHILEHDKIAHGFAATLSNMISQAINKNNIQYSPAPNFGLPTPSKSAETSPELCQIDANASLDAYSTLTTLNDDCVDPILFPSAARDLSFPSDTTVMDLPCEQIDANPTAASDLSSPHMQPGNLELLDSTCGNCFSQNVFKTTGRGVQIDACGDYRSTDILYGMMVVPIQNKSETDWLVNALDITDSLEDFGGDFSWLDDCVGASLNENEAMFEAIDKVFEI